jgi:cytochrome c oxidase subunit 2
MDAVPGIPTTLWFTPLYTTEEMKIRTGNPNFVYEVSCNQMCGKGHFSMRGVIIVETEEEYRKYLATLDPQYWTVYPDKKPKPANAAPAVADSAKVKTPIAAVMPATN